MSLGMKIWDSTGRKVLDMADFTVRLVFILQAVTGGVNYDVRCKAGMIGVPVSKSTAFSYTPGNAMRGPDYYNNMPKITVYDGYFVVGPPLAGYNYHANVAVYFMVNV